MEKAAIPGKKVTSAKKASDKPGSFQNRRTAVIFYASVAIITLIAIVPFIYVISASFQSEWSIKTGVTTLIPQEFTLRNYQDVLSNTEGSTAFSSYLLNSFKVGMMTFALTTCVSVIAAYGLSRYTFPGRETIAQCMLFLFVFPTILAIFPIYNVLAQFGLTNSHLGLVLVHTTLVAPFCTWLLRSFFNAIPIEVEEAARVDGANRLVIIIRILLPLSAPGLLAAGMYALVYSWGEFMFASILIDSGSLKTIPIALATYMNHIDQKWGRLLAGCSLNFVPLLVCFFPLLKTFLKGFTAGAVKG